MDKGIDRHHHRIRENLVCLVVLLCAASSSQALSKATEVEKIGEELASMVARGEPMGRIEVRWESLLSTLDQEESFVALGCFLNRGLEGPLASLSEVLAKQSQREAEARVRALSRLSSSKTEVSRSHLIALETGISELVDLLHGIDKELGEVPNRADLISSRAALETLGRTARELRRSARRRFETG